MDGNGYWDVLSDVSKNRMSTGDNIGESDRDESSLLTRTEKLREIKNVSLKSSNSRIPISEKSFHRWLRPQKTVFPPCASDSSNSDFCSDRDSLPTESISETKTENELTISESPYAWLRPPNFLEITNSTKNLHTSASLKLDCSEKSINNKHLFGIKDDLPNDQCWLQPSIPNDNHSEILIDETEKVCENTNPFDMPHRYPWIRPRTILPESFSDQSVGPAEMSLDCVTNTPKLQEKDFQILWQANDECLISKAEQQHNECNHTDEEREIFLNSLSFNPSDEECSSFIKKNNTDVKGSNHTRYSKSDGPKSKGISLKHRRRTDERGILLKVYSTFVLVIDIIILFMKMTFAWITSFIELVSTREERDVKGEVVLITGTGHGIGREMAIQFAQLGAIVVCVDINQEANEQTLKEVEAINKGGKAFAYKCDVSKRDQVMDLAKRIRSDTGEVSILVNNAGIMPCKSLTAHSEGEVRTIFDVNVMANIWMIQAFLPSMVERNHGNIVALSSMAGLVGVKNLVPYCGSKFAVRGLMEALHEEIREDPRGLQIKVTCVCPYMVDTGLCKKPKIRFPNLMGLVEPQEAAQRIIQATRQGEKEITIPSHLYYVNKICRAMPLNVPILLKDFLDSGVESDI